MIIRGCTQDRPRRGIAPRIVVAGTVAVMAVLTLAGPATAAPASGARPGHVSEPVARELQAALDDVVAAGATGVIVRVDDGARTYRLASGRARLDPSQRMRPEARIRVGSITKSFVATVALQLVGEGRLSLGDTVERWQPGLIPGGEAVTVRQLLNHTSGLFDYEQDAALAQQVLTHPLVAVTPQEVVDVATSHPPVFAPGTSWSYSSTNYVVIGLILERVTGRSVSELLDRRIIRPLHLRHTVLSVSPDIRGYHAHGYRPPSLTGAGYVDLTRISPTWAWAAGALVSNVDDVRRFYRALLGGRLLRPAQLVQMKTLVPMEGGGYGLGLYSLPTPCGTIWGHDGGIFGYGTIAWNDETGRRGITVGLPTERDPEIGAAFGRLLAVATCRMLGQEPPPVASAAATDRASAGAWLR
jgi:D-alanyl-D-alanine carboxypeptidase